jgi:hypothetical protein
MQTVMKVRGEGGAVEALVGDAMVSLLAAAGIVHVTASLVMLASTKRMRPGARTFLLAVSLLVPVIGPVLAVFTAWSARQTAGSGQQSGRRL